MTTVRLPHPIPYQGSKRRLAQRILSVVGQQRFATLYEPFAGSAAITIAAGSANLAERFLLGDTLEPLTELWQSILNAPEQLADEYERVWTAQLAAPAEHYLAVRDDFNENGEAAQLLYLLARCVKNSPRFNGAGQFNQSPDHRRRGMNPAKMRGEIGGAANVLAGRTSAECADFAELLATATPSDLVYMDPPWEGTSQGTDKRYREWLTRERLIAVLEDLHERGVPYLLSYDGRHGDKQYGEPLPDSIGANRLELDAGRSSQATLNGRAVTTYESLYVSTLLTVAPVVVEQLGLFAEIA